MNYGQRLRTARKHRGMTQRELSEQSGVTEASISKIERGDQESSSFNIKLAEALHIRAKWLDEGTGEMLIKEGEIDSYTLVEIPVLNLSYVCEYMASKIIPNGTRMLQTPRKSGPNSFVAILVDDSMLSAVGKSYPAGTAVYIDPSLEIENNCRVLAARGDDDPIFRVYREDAGKKWLIPLNFPMWEKIELTDEWRILGRSFFMGMDD